jgi:predicted Zn finger-like uncharacterized protein
MSEPGSGELTLICPACGTRFGVSLEGRGPQNVHVSCTACEHLFTTDEMLHAMATSLNELLEQARNKISSKKP